MTIFESRVYQFFNYRYQMFQFLPNFNRLRIHKISMILIHVLTLTNLLTQSDLALICPDFYRNSKIIAVTH